MELIPPFAPPRCPQCKAIGTIVQLGKCCIVKLLREQDEASNAKDKAGSTRFPV